MLRIQHYKYALMIQSHNSLLTFLLNGKRFALSLNTVESVVRAVAVTSIPGAHEMFYGIIDYHGTVVPAINLRHRLGFPSKEISLSDRFVIVNTAKRKLALVVDELEDVHKIGEDDQGEIDVKMTENQSDESKSPGIEIVPYFRDEHGIILIYDVEKLLDSEMEIHLTALLENEVQPVS